MPRSLLIFGITGELGSRVARLAVARGHKVYGVSRGGNVRDRADLTGVEIFSGDKYDRDFLANTLSKLPVDAVLDTIPRPEGINNIHEFFPQAKNVFLVSSTGTFVPLQAMPADETHPWREENHVNFHGKIANDKLALELFEKDNFPVTIFRPTNIIGDGRVPLDLFGARDIEFFRALRNSKPLTLPDCRQVLLQSGCNWDLAKAMTLALDAGDKIAGEIIVISTAQAIRLQDYLQTAMEYLNSKSEITWVDADEFYKTHPEHSGLPFLREHMCFNIDKARKLLGYEPDYTGKEGLLKALEWCRESGLL